jgi:hypothetical protein
MYLENAKLIVHQMHALDLEGKFHQINFSRFLGFALATVSRLGHEPMSAISEPDSPRNLSSNKMSIYFEILLHCYNQRRFLNEIQLEFPTKDGKFYI